jgi:hypothetical protein
MARVTFTPEHKMSSGNPDFPRLRIPTKGEHTRIVCLEDPEFAWVHRLQMPKILNGRPEVVTKTRKDGTEYDDYKYEYLGSPLCLGDPNTLAERGSDPANCPICALASEGDMARNPIRRFAMHVIEYGTKPGSSELSSPFSVSVKVWAFTDRIFSKLVDLATEWGSLQQHDLLLGPCTNVDFQQWDIGVSARASWAEDEARKQLTIETFKANQAPDLVAYCGRSTERRWLEQDIGRIHERWRFVNAPRSVPTDGSAIVGGDPLAGLVEFGLEASNSEPPTEKKPVSMDDLLGNTGSGQASTGSDSGPSFAGFQDLLS